MGKSTETPRKTQEFRSVFGGRPQSPVPLIAQVRRSKRQTRGGALTGENLGQNGCFLPITLMPSKPKSTKIGNVLKSSVQMMFCYGKFWSNPCVLMET